MVARQCLCHMLWSNVKASQKEELCLLILDILLPHLLSSIWWKEETEPNDVSSSASLALSSHLHNSTSVSLAELWVLWLHLFRVLTLNWDLSNRKIGWGSGLLQEMIMGNKMAAIINIHCPWPPTTKHTFTFCDCHIFHILNSSKFQSFTWIISIDHIAIPWNRHSRHHSHFTDGLTVTRRLAELAKIAEENSNFFLSSGIRTLKPSRAHLSIPVSSKAPIPLDFSYIGSVSISSSPPPFPLSTFGSSPAPAWIITGELAFQMPLFPHSSPSCIIFLD